MSPGKPLPIGGDSAARPPVYGRTDCQNRFLIDLNALVEQSKETGYQEGISAMEKICSDRIADLHSKIKVAEDRLSQAVRTHRWDGFSLGVFAGILLSGVVVVAFALGSMKL